MAQAGNEIGAVLLFRRKSICAKLNMLKFIPKAEYGQRTTPFYEGVFLCPKAHGLKTTSIGGVVFLLSLSRKNTGGLQIEENNDSQIPTKARD